MQLLAMTQVLREMLPSVGQSQRRRCFASPVPLSTLVAPLTPPPFLFTALSRACLWYLNRCDIFLCHGTFVLNNPCSVVVGALLLPYSFKGDVSVAVI